MGLPASSINPFFRIILKASFSGSSSGSGGRYELKDESAQVKYWFFVSGCGNNAAYLSVVAGEIKVVQCVVSWRVDIPLQHVTRDHIAIMDEDGPDLNKDE